MKVKTGIELITEERLEQLEKHNWTSKHDDKHKSGELAYAAAICASTLRIYHKHEYANNIHFDVLAMKGWKLPLNWDGNVLLDNCKNPLLNSSYKIRIHQLKVAGALIAAEIDRLNRLKRA